MARNRLKQSAYKGAVLGVPNETDHSRSLVGTVITLDQLEDAGISFVPCGQVDGKDQPVTQYAHLLKARRQVTRQTYGKKWYGQAIRNANGLQLMTGYPTFRPAPGKNFYYYTSLDIEKLMREEHPGFVDDIIKIY